jgi:hypothetical protein
METVLINIGIFLLIAVAIALPVVLLARYTHRDEPAGNRFLGLFLGGLSDVEKKDRPPP